MWAMPNKKNRAGLSLVEVLVALGVIAVGMAGVTASLIFGASKSNYGSDLETATRVSRTIIEEIEGRNLVSAPPLGGDNLPTNASKINDTDGDLPRPLLEPPLNDPKFFPATSHDGKDIADLEKLREKYTRKVQLRRRGAKGTNGENLVDIKVTVYWMEKGVRKSVVTTAVTQTGTSLP